MKQAFCTIITSDYYPYALALAKSLGRFGKYQFYVYVTDCGPEKFNPGNIPDGMTCLFNEDLLQDETGKKIYAKYATEFMDGFRWSMKPVLMRYILAGGHAGEVLFCDCDLYFYSDPSFLFDLLRQYNLILNPHWRSSDPETDYWQYMLLYTQGLFNGGFVGASEKGIPALEWWAKACEKNCEINPFRGMFVDQVHLNLLPVYFPGTGIIQHRGCDLASWNIYECRREFKEGKVLINGKYPVVFIHFTGGTIKGILSEKDPLLKPHLDEYILALKDAGIKTDIIRKYKDQIEAGKKKKKPSLLLRIRRKLVHFLEEK